MTVNALEQHKSLRLITYIQRLGGCTEVGSSLSPRAMSAFPSEEGIHTSLGNRNCFLYVISIGSYYLENRGYSKRCTQFKNRVEVPSCYIKCLKIKLC